MTCPACGRDDSVIAIEPNTGLHKNCRLTMRNLRIASPATMREMLERTHRLANIEGSLR